MSPLNNKLDRVRLDRAAFIAQEDKRPDVFRDKLAEIQGEDREVTDMDRAKREQEPGKKGGGDGTA